MLTGQPRAGKSGNDRCYRVGPLHRILCSRPGHLVKKGGRVTMLRFISRCWADFTAVQVIDCCRRHRLFNLLNQHPASMATIVAQLRANEGYLRIALRLLTEIGWLARDSTGAYQVTARSSLAGQIPNNVSELATTHPTASGHGQPVEHWLSIWLEHSANGWDGADPGVAELLDGGLPG